MIHVQPPLKPSTELGTPPRSMLTPISSCSSTARKTWTAVASLVLLFGTSVGALAGTVNATVVSNPPQFAAPVLSGLVYVDLGDTSELKSCEQFASEGRYNSNQGGNTFTNVCPPRNSNPCGLDTSSDVRAITCIAKLCAGPWGGGIHQAVPQSTILIPMY